MMSTSDFYATHHDTRLRFGNQRAGCEPGRFAHLQPAVTVPVDPNLYQLLEVPDPSEFARATLAAAARVSGEKPIAAVDWFTTPTQQQALATGADILRVAKRQGLAQ